MKHDVRPAQPGEINGSYFDRFTLVHFASGYAFGKLPISNIEALVIAIGWEIIEDRLKEKTRRALYLLSLLFEEQSPFRIIDN